MSKEETVVDSADEAVDTENVEVSTEDVAKLQEELAYFKEQAEFHKTDKKKAFEQRDKAKETARVAKKDAEAKTDMEKYIETLEAEKLALNAKIVDIENKDVRNSKLSALKEFAKKQGMMEEYLDALPKLTDVNIDELDPERPVTLRIAVDTVRSKFPVFFNANSEAVDRALPNPKLNAGGIDYEKAYSELLNAKPQDRKPDHFEKLAELKEAMTATK